MRGCAPLQPISGNDDIPSPWQCAVSCERGCHGNRYRMTYCIYSRYIFSFLSNWKCQKEKWRWSLLRLKDVARGGMRGTRLVHLMNIGIFIRCVFFKIYHHHHRSYLGGPTLPLQIWQCLYLLCINSVKAFPGLGMMRCALLTKYCDSLVGLTFHTGKHTNRDQKVKKTSVSVK